ncbi:MAG: hypothetical protein EPN39_00865 [Chitinophagaceae bacterium]|nr:MAG: hypothetical protein EPN39_00865 [Chitinophagaceae bacterium]
MPLQCGPLLITGTIDDVCFYQMEGQYYARRKSSLTRKRVLKDPKFLLTRVHAVLLGEASKIASRVYRQITGERKKHALYREITGKAIYLLREGKDKEAAFEILCGQYLKPEPTEQVASVTLRKDIAAGEKLRNTPTIPLPTLKSTYFPLPPPRRRRRRFIAMAHWEKQYALGP